MSTSPTPAPLPSTVPVRVGVVGLGYWGRKLARRYQQLSGAQLVAICDHNPAALARAATAHPDVPAVSHLLRMLEHGPELVVVATEPSSHVAIASAQGQLSSSPALKRQSASAPAAASRSINRPLGWCNSHSSICSIVASPACCWMWIAPFCQARTCNFPMQ